MRLIIVGGFLGAGKTTALIAAARRLTERGLQVGVITNDQGSELVDSALVESRGLRGAAVTGGCFCCRFDELVAAAERLRVQARPDVLLAEPVGSCTDLAATVVRPLQRFYGQRIDVAPLSILVDPLTLAERLPGSTRFPPDVAYLFERQLAEADMLVLTRGDLLDPAAQSRALAQVGALCPGVPRRVIAAPTGAGVDGWLDALLAQAPAGRAALELDYDRYAAGEAALGWLNAALSVAGERPVAPDAIVGDLLEGLARRLAERGSEVAHIKVQAQCAAGVSKASVVLGAAPTFDVRCAAPAASLRALVNARALCPPEAMEAALREAAAELEARRGVRAQLSGVQAFAPPRPTPAHRILAARAANG